MIPPPMGGFIGAWMDGWVSGLGHFKALKSDQS